MTGERTATAPDAGFVNALRNLNDAAIAARPYVVEEAGLENAGLGPIRGNPARETLDKLDGAIADAGEHLAGVTS